MLVLKKCKTFKLSSTNICGILLTLCTSWDRGTNKVSWVMRWIHFRHEASLLSHIARENKNSLSLSHPYTCTHIHSHILTHIHTHTHKQTRQKRRDTQLGSLLWIGLWQEICFVIWKVSSQRKRWKFWALFCIILFATSEYVSVIINLQSLLTKKQGRVFES